MSILYRYVIDSTTIDTHPPCSDAFQAQEATEVATNPIQDSRANLLEEGGNDTVQPCDTTQVRLDSDFGVKSATVQVYGNSYNSQSDRGSS